MFTNVDIYLNALQACNHNGNANTYPEFS